MWVYAVRGCPTSACGWQMWVYTFRMPYGLKRYQQSKQSHFLTFSCYHRLPGFANERLRDIFLECLERIRRHYQFHVYGYVVMPEHIHLLLSEPAKDSLATTIQALKVSLIRHRELPHGDRIGTFWQKRYYDHNVRSYSSFVEKLRYIHRNPVKRGLCNTPMEWRWSSFRHYANAEVGPVEVESRWTADRRRGRDPRLLGS
jgi:putative transposase